MIIKILSYSIKGIASVDVCIEVSVAVGLAKFEIIGLADTAIKESKERIFKAILENGYKVPPGNITINLAPAKIKKRGTMYDLPIALGILLASGQIKKNVDLDNYLIVGELSLNGDVRGVEGFFISLLENESKKKEYTYIIPRDNIRNVLPFQNLLDRVYPVSNLKEAIELLKFSRDISNKDFKKTISSLDIKSNTKTETPSSFYKSLDFNDVLGNRLAKVGLQLAIIAKLNVLFVGPPGCGKSMLMERVPTILPSLEKEDSLLVTRIHNSKNTKIDSLVKDPPFRKVHNSIHATSLIGGGKYPEPGEITLAHKGFLFMDELSEYNQMTLQNLRMPLEKKVIQINRVEEQVVYPCDFVLLACTNPCACGYYGDDIKMCRCSRGAMNRFYTRLSGPLLDRFDVILFINKLDRNEFEGKEKLTSQVMKKNILEAKAREDKIKNPFLNKNMQQIFSEDKYLKEIFLKANEKQFVSLRKINSILKVIYALMLYYNQDYDKNIILKAIDFCRNKINYLSE